MFEAIFVLHHAKSGPDAAAAEAAWLGAAAEAGVPVWSLETCQRRVHVFPEGHPWSWQEPAAGLSLHQGTEAYRFLLELATGLASRIAGETNIFGQMKSAWACHARGHRWLQWLFADAKEIRSRFLSEVGGASYGRLVQQLLRRKGLGHDATILLVGAGEMASEIAPWLRGWKLQIVNRTPERAEELAAKLRHHPGHPVEAVAGAEADAAWLAADVVIPCVPFDAAADARRCAALREAHAGTSKPLVVHLGGSRKQAGPWNDLVGFHCLDDLFELHEAMDGVRTVRVARARRACAERAEHRELGAALSLAHGWEDLTNFARTAGLMPVAA